MDDAGFDGGRANYFLGSFIPDRATSISAVEITPATDAVVFPREVTLGIRRKGKMYSAEIVYTPATGIAVFRGGPPWKVESPEKRLGVSKIALFTDGGEGNVKAYLDEVVVAEVNLGPGISIGVFEMTVPANRKIPSDYVRGIRYMEEGSDAWKSLDLTRISLAGIPEKHAYLAWDDTKRVHATLVYHVPKDATAEPQWKEKLELAGEVVTNLHNGFLGDVVDLDITVHPEIIRGRRGTEEYRSIDFTSGMNLVIDEVCGQVTVPEEQFLQVLVLSEARLGDETGDYSAGMATYYRLGSSWGVSGAKIMRSLPSAIPENLNLQVAYPGSESKCHWSWPYCALYYGILKGYRIPRADQPNTSILGGGLFYGIYAATMPDWVSEGMEGTFPAMDVDETIDGLLRAADTIPLHILAPILERNAAQCHNLYLKTGIALASSGTEERAQKYLKYAAYTAEGNPYELYMISHVLYENRCYAGALTVVEKILQQDPCYPYAYNMRAYVYMYSPAHKSNEKALEALDKALLYFTSKADKQSVRNDIEKIIGKGEAAEK